MQELGILARTFDGMTGWPSRCEDSGGFMAPGEDGAKSDSGLPARFLCLISGVRSCANHILVPEDSRPTRSAARRQPPPIMLTPMQAPCASRAGFLLP